MTGDELADLIARLRRYGSDIAGVEVKKAGTSTLPKTLRETLSAFANSAGGGVIVLGLDEASGFASTGVGDPGKMAADLASLAADQMEPPVRPLIEPHDFEGIVLVVAEVPELPPEQKPCFYKGAGLTNGSFVRSGDGDRRLSAYEVQMMLASRGQPRDDEEPVHGSALEDLDQDLTRLFLARMRETRPSVFSTMGDEEILKATRILLREDGGEDCLSIGGLLALGRYPQSHFPQLNLTFVHYPTEDGQPLPSGERFLDNVTIEGPIPVMVRDALAALRRNMRRRSIISGPGRLDVWDYPEPALREVVVNALAHRDLSSASRGTPVQIEMYPERLIVRNPGGLFGPVAVDDLGEEGVSSSRNASLLKILEDVPMPGDNRPVCENRGSGVRVMIGSLRTAGMSPPRFDNRISTFSVTFPKHSLLSEETIRWIESLGQEDLSDSQHIGLALLHEGETLDNSSYRSASGIDSRHATAELQDLVARELVHQHGSRRWATYTLAVGTEDEAGTAARLAPADRRAEILQAIGSETLSRAEIADRTGLPDQVVLRWLKKMREEEAIERSPGPTQAKGAKYRVLGRRESNGDVPLFEL